MASYHKGESDVVEPSEHAPQQVSYHDVVFILTPHNCLCGGGHPSRRAHVLPRSDGAYSPLH